MATPTNLLELMQQRLTTSTDEKTAAQAALQAAQTTLTGALADLQAANDKFTAQTDEIDSLRARLAAISTPADAPPLLAALEAATIARRAATADILVQQSDVDMARMAAESARARLQRADSALVAANADVAAEEAAHTKREAAKTALTTAPLVDLPTRAADLKASSTYTDAQARIDTDFPQALQDQALARAAFTDDKVGRAFGNLTDVQDLIDDYHSSNGNFGDEIAALEDALDEAEQALASYVARASSRCDAAEAVLLRIGGAANPALSAEEHDAIDDAALLADREAAATAENDRDAAADAVNAAQSDYDLEYLKVFAASGAAGVTAALADATSDLAVAKDTLDTATADLAQMEIDYTNAMRDTLKAWRAAVPDSAWRDLADFNDATNTLDALAASPTGLTTALTNAEAALLAALLDLDEESALLGHYVQALELSAGAATVAHALADRVRASALRGDA